MENIFVIGMLSAGNEVWVAIAHFIHWIWPVELKIWPDEILEQCFHSTKMQDVHFMYLKLTL